MSVPNTAPAATSRLVAALLGNPNTGKTTLFNALSGLNHRVGNYPGVTVESKKGQMTCDGTAFELVDLPGTYSLAPRSPDEMVAVDVILGRQVGEARPDVVVCIVDASNLERNLYLTTQALELGVPIVVALNMIDVAESQGLKIDVGLLAERFGVPIIPIQANRKRGLDELRTAIARAAAAAPPQRLATFPEVFNREVEDLLGKLGSDVPTFLARRLLLDVGGFLEERFADRLRNGLNLGQVRERLAAAGCPVASLEARTRYGWIRELTAGGIQRPAQRPVSWTDRIDRLLTHRLWGTLVFLVVMFLMFEAIYAGARPLMGLIGGSRDLLTDYLGGILPQGPFTSLLLDGAIRGVGDILVFLPQILILFAFIAILEDCGYMARAAFLMDRLMSRAGLSGKSFIPLLSSMACAVPGIMATRVIEERRDRLATILVAPLMSCSARLPVYILLIGAFLTVGYPIWLPGLVMFCMYALGLVLAPLIAWALKRTMLRGKTPVFVLEMPAYKWPSFGGVLRRVFDAGSVFVRRAGTVILACSVIVWVLLNYPMSDYPDRIAALKDKGEAGEEEMKLVLAEYKRQSLLGRVGQAIEPAVRPLGWDWRVGVAVLASFPAREVVVSTLGIIYQQGEVDTDEIREAWGEKMLETNLGKALRDATWDDDPARKVFTVPAALSLMVFFALCCQCASTLAVIRRETGTWRWPIFTFVYMTTLAYIGALLTFQVGTWLS